MANKGGSFWSDSAVQAALISGLFLIIGGIIVALFEDRLDDDPAPTATAAPSIAAALLASTPTPTPPTAPLQPTPTPEQAPPTPTPPSQLVPTPTLEPSGNGYYRWDSETGFTDWAANRTWDIAEDHIIRNDDIEQTHYLSPANLDDARSFSLYIAFTDVPPPPQTGLVAFGAILADASSGTAFWVGLSVSPNLYDSQYVVWYFDGTNSVHWLSQPLFTAFAGGDVRFEITVNGNYLYLAVNGQGAVGGTLVDGFGADLTGVYASAEGIKVTQFIVSPAGL